MESNASKYGRIEVVMPSSSMPILKMLQDPWDEETNNGKCDVQQNICSSTVSTNQISPFVAWCIPHVFALVDGGKIDVVMASSRVSILKMLKNLSGEEISIPKCIMHKFFCKRA